MTQLDDICPRYVGAKRIVLTLGQEAVPAAFSTFAVDVDVSGTLPEGLMLPLELIVQGPSPESYQRRILRRSVPSRVLIKLREGGEHLVQLAEIAHNRWWGALIFTAAGEPLSKGERF